MNMTRLVLVRHAEVRNPDGIVYGMLAGYPLSERGFRQAGELAEDLKKVCGSRPTVVTSPALRALQTSKTISDASGAGTVTADPRLGEWGLGKWEGESIKDFYASSGYLDDPARVTSDETFDEMANRVLGALQDLRKSVEGGCGIAVSHREPLVVAILKLQGRPWKDSGEMDFPVASAWEIVYTDDARPPEIKKIADRHDVK